MGGKLAILSGTRIEGVRGKFVVRGQTRMGGLSSAIARDISWSREGEVAGLGIDGGGNPQKTREAIFKRGLAR